jgi:hypothetical protein
MATIDKFRRSGTEQDLEELASLARYALGAIRRLTLGEPPNRKPNKLAFHTWRDVLHGELTNFAQSVPAVLQTAQALAETLPHWPGLLTVDSNVDKDNKALIDTLRLGESAGRNFKGKQASFNTIEVLVAHNLLSLLKDHGKEPSAPLNRSTYNLWWKAAEPFLEAEAGKDFENHHYFKKYWKNAAYQNRAEIRRDIKRKIKQAFRSLAPKKKIEM